MEKFITYGDEELMSSILSIPDDLDECVEELPCNNLELSVSYDADDGVIDYDGPNKLLFELTIHDLDMCEDPIVLFRVSEVSTDPYSDDIYNAISFILNNLNTILMLDPDNNRSVIDCIKAINLRCNYSSISIIDPNVADLFDRVFRIYQKCIKELLVDK